MEEPIKKYLKEYYNDAPLTKFFDILIEKHIYLRKYGSVKNSQDGHVFCSIMDIRNERMSIIYEAYTKHLKSLLENYIKHLKSLLENAVLVTEVDLTYDKIFSFLKSQNLLIEGDYNVVNEDQETILSLSDYDLDLKEFYSKYVKYISDLVSKGVYESYVTFALFKNENSSLLKSNCEVNEDNDEDGDIIEDFIKENPNARKEDFFQFLKTKGFEIDDKTFYINRKGEVYSSLDSYEDFVLGLFVKEYKDVLTIYKTAINMEKPVEYKEKILSSSEIEVKKMRKKFIEI